MRKLMAPIIIVAMALSSCAASVPMSEPSVSSSKPTASKSSVPTASVAAQPTTHPELSVRKGGELFRRQTCPRNRVVMKLGDVVDATWIAAQKGYAYEKLDLQQVKKMAKQQRSIDRSAIDKYEDEVWPKPIRKPMATYVDGLYEEITWLNQLAVSATKYEFVDVYTHGPDSTATAVAAQKIRKGLKLSADPLNGCPA